LRPRKTALILSGGGARGAYEVGVLSYVLDRFARLRGVAPRFDVLCGTSVGAINACFLAAHLADPTVGIRRLVDLWTALDLSDVLGFGMGQAIGLHRLVLGGGQRETGIFDVTPMARLIEREIPWRAIARTLRHGHFSALSVSATALSTGRTVTFMQTGPDGSLPTRAPPRTVGELFMDGGVRQNTPIAPALRLGATHVFAVGLSREVRGVGADAEAEKIPGVAMVIGKVLNAFLLDHVQTDLEVLSRINDVIADGEAAYGSDFLPKVNAEAQRRGETQYQRVETLVVRPSEDIGRLAADYVRKHPPRGGAGLARRLLTLVDVGEATEADLASYLLFDGPFAKKLIDLGRADAEARRRDIADFFGSAADDGPRGAGDPDAEPWSMPPPVA
jgi:NTE family protein